MVNLVESGRKVNELAENLGVSQQAIDPWRRQARVDRGEEVGLRSVKKAELTAMRKRVRVGALRVESSSPIGTCRSAEPRGTHEARRIHAELTLVRNVRVGLCAVEMLMRRAGLRGAAGGPRFRRVPNVPSADDHVNRDFERDGPNQLWITDITEHRCREGEVYCAVVLDAFSWRVVGWAIDSSATASLTTNALAMAIEQRCPPKGLVIRSDQGTQFTSWALTKRAVASGLVPPWGRSAIATTAR